MAFVVADRVQESSSTSGTGALSLGGAVTGYQSFVSGIGNGNSTYYTIYDPTAFVWEVGIGAVTSGSPDTLSRTAVLANSSGTTSPLSLAGNAINVWCDYPAKKAVLQDLYGSAYAPQIAADNGLLTHNATVSTSYTVDTGYNVISAGPIAVASGATVTLPAGSTWVIA